MSGEKNHPSSNLEKFWGGHLDPRLRKISKRNYKKIEKEIDDILNKIASIGPPIKKLKKKIDPNW